MFKLLKEYKRTILFVLIIIIVIAGIFIYRRVQANKGVYEPDLAPVVNEIKKYEDNSYNVLNVNKVDVYRAYYKNYTRLLFNDVPKAYELLTTDCRKNMFNNDYEKFKEFVKTLDRQTLITSDVSRYSEQDGKIIVVDSNESSLIFYENGVWNYQVYITGRIN